MSCPGELPTSRGSPSEVEGDDHPPGVESLWEFVELAVFALLRDEDVVDLDLFGVDDRGGGKTANLC